VTGIYVIEMSGASGANGRNSTELRFCILESRWFRIFLAPSSLIDGGTGGTSPVSQGGFGGGAFGVKLGGGGGGYSSGGVVGS